MNHEQDQSTGNETYLFAYGTLTRQINKSSDFCDFTFVNFKIYFFSTTKSFSLVELNVSDEWALSWQSNKGMKIYDEIALQTTTLS